jgi:hypothetical protein
MRETQLSSGSRRKACCGGIPGVSQRILGSRVTAALCTRAAKRPASMWAGNRSASTRRTRVARSPAETLEARRLCEDQIAASSPGRRPHRSLSVHCLNPRYPRTIPGTQTCRPAARKRRFAGVSASWVPQIYCLPCRRSRVRIPSAALEKDHLQVFFRCAVSSTPVTSPVPCRPSVV